MVNGVRKIYSFHRRSFARSRHVPHRMHWRPLKPICSLRHSQRSATWRRAFRSSWWPPTNSAARPRTHGPCCPKDRAAIPAQRQSPFWFKVQLESTMGPTLVDPSPAGAPGLARLRRARPGAPAGHGSTSVGPTVDSNVSGIDQPMSDCVRR